jgi:ribonuclease D
MPNMISKNKRSVTFLEDREVFEWMEAIARERDTDVSRILREATSSYYVLHGAPSSSPNLFETRSATKIAQRKDTDRQIASGGKSAAEVQEQNAPIHQPIQIVNLGSSIRRFARAKP